MREIGPIERAIAVVEKFERDLRLLKQELAAQLPDRPDVQRDWITNPITGKRVKIKKK